MLMSGSDLMMKVFKEHLLGRGTCLAYPIYLLGLTIYAHRSYWTKPDEQKRILVLISIPVVLGILSVVALNLNEDCKTLFLVLDSIKDCSAGLGIAMFMGLLQAYMNINTTKCSAQDFRDISRGRLIYNVFPVTLVQPRSVLLNLDNLKLLNFWTWQFVVIRLACSVFMIVLQLLDMYPLWLSWAFFFILNVSASLAFYTAYAFYLAFKEDFPQQFSNAWFLYIRGIFFVCFWQGGVLKVLVAMGIIKSNHFWRQELHNSLLVFETLIFVLFQTNASSLVMYFPRPPLHPKQH